LNVVRVNSSPTENKKVQKDKRKAKTKFLLQRRANVTVQSIGMSIATNNILGKRYP
jgi:hypothetical protein